MQMYEKLFSEYGHTVAQVLLTREDIEDRRRHLNARHALLALLRFGVIPIINENDYRRRRRDQVRRQRYL